MFLNKGEKMKTLSKNLCVSVIICLLLVSCFTLSACSSNQITIQQIYDKLSDYTLNGSATASGNQVVLSREGSLLSANTYEDASVSYGLKLTAGNSFACMVGDESISFASDGDI